MGNHPHDGSGSGRSQRRGQAIEVDGGGGEPVDGRHSEHQGRPAIGTSPAKRVSSMEDIRRKRGDYKAAVEKLAAGHVAEGLDRLDNHGRQQADARRRSLRPCNGHITARPKGHRKPLSGFSDPPPPKPSADAPPGHRLEALTVLYPNIVFGAINPIGQARRARR